MPKRRSLAELLRKHDAIAGDSAARSPDHQWLRFLDDLPHVFLVAVAAGFADPLTPRHRRALHAHLAWASTVYSSLVGQGRDTEAVRLLDTVANTIASGDVGRQIRGAAKDCDGIVLLRHLAHIEQFLHARPRTRNRQVRLGLLRDGLAGLFKVLAQIPCTVPHGPRPLSRPELDGWVTLRAAPLAEQILAYHHRKSPATIHKRVSRVHRLLTDFLRDS